MANLRKLFYKWPEGWILWQPCNSVLGAGTLTGHGHTLPTLTCTIKHLLWPLLAHTADTCPLPGQCHLSTLVNHCTWR